MQRRGVQLVMAATYHTPSLQRARTMYSPTWPSRATVWSNTVGTLAMKLVHSCSLRYLLGLSASFAGRFEEGVHGHLVYAGALAHGVVVDGAEGAARGVDGGAGGVVHGAGEHAQVGRADVVAREVVQGLAVDNGFPLGILQTLDALEVEDVGVGALYARRA